jgi:hypothetical protein
LAEARNGERRTGETQRGARRGWRQMEAVGINSKPRRRPARSPYRGQRSSEPPRVQKNSLDVARRREDSGDVGLLWSCPWMTNRAEQRRNGTTAVSSNLHGRWCSGELPSMGTIGGAAASRPGGVALLRGRRIGDVPRQRSTPQRRRCCARRCRVAVLGTRARRS